MYRLPAHVKSSASKHGKSTRKHPEQTLQTQVATFLHWALPPDIPWSAIGHGGGGKLRGMILKGMGVQAGWPDLHLIVRGRPIYIEIKSASGTLSEAQKAVHSAITVAGGVVSVCRSVDDVRAFLEILGVPLQARLMPADRAAARYRLTS